MDFKDKTEVEIKAMLFDEICKLEQLQYNINVLKQELIKKQEPSKKLED